MRILAILLCLVAAALAAIQPVGVVRLFGPEDTGDAICNDPCWTNENCDGGRLRIAWDQYEATEGTFYWNTNAGGCTGTPPTAVCSGNSLDCAVGKAFESKKFIGISFSAGVNCPHWIYDSAGVYKFMLDATNTSTPGDPFQPIIWDTIFKTKWQNTVNAFAAHVATLPGKSAIRYIVACGFAKQVDMRTWCQNFDASVVVNDATVTNIDATYCKVESATMHFLTHADQVSGSIVGINIEDTRQSCLQDPNSTNCIFRGGSVVCSTTPSAACPGGAPANPTDTVVYIGKNAWQTGSGKHATAAGWLVGKGEFYQMDQIALTPPLGAAGLVGTGNPAGMTGSSGNYVAAAKTIIGYFMSAFPTYNVILTKAAPYDTPQGVTDSQTIDDYLRITYGNRYGPMVVSRQASCPPHENDNQVTWATFVKGAQALYPSGHAGLYDNAACPFAQNIVIDLMEAFYDHADKYWEIYANDVESMNPATGDPALVAAGRYERARLLFANPQPENRATIQVTF